MKQNLNEKAVTIFNFFKKKNLGDIFLYFDNNFNDYYIVVTDKICDTTKYNSVINEYMRAFDISNIHVLSKKYLLNIKDLELVDKFINYTNITTEISHNISKFFMETINFNTHNTQYNYKKN